MELWKKIWNWLSIGTNAGATSVVVAVIVGVANYWPLFHQGEGKTPPQDPGSSAASTVVTVITNPPSEGLGKYLAQLNQEQQQKIVELEKQAGITKTAVDFFLTTLGEAGVPQEKWLEKLVEIAQRHKALLANVKPEAGDDAGLAALKQEAATALKALQYEKADEVYARIQAHQDRGLEAGQRAAAKTAADRGELALNRLRYKEAAAHFAAAARRLPPGDDDEEYREREEESWYRQGDEFGDNEAMGKAIELRRQQVDRHPRQRDPLAWACYQNNLGNALGILGGRESGTKGLEEAVAAYRAALAEFTREGVPLDWAATQNNLGNVLRALGERESETGRLEEAVVAYRGALEEYTRERVPLAWATTQNNLGNALQTLGERESGTQRLEEAVVAYRAALAERTRERVPLDWAMTQNNLGLALATLGERENETERLEEAVAAYRAALAERTRERVPLSWAMTQNNLGNALRTLGEREGGTERLEEAVAALQAALAVYQESGSSHYIEMAASNLQTAQARLKARQ